MPDELIKKLRRDQIPDGDNLSASAAVKLLAFGRIATPDEEMASLDSAPSLEQIEARVGPPMPARMHPGVIAWERATAALFSAHVNDKLTLIGQRQGMEASDKPEPLAPIPKIYFGNELMLCSNDTICGNGKPPVPPDLWRNVRMLREDFIAAFATGGQKKDRSPAKGKRRRPVEERTILAIDAVYPGGIPVGQTMKELLKPLNEWLAKLEPPRAAVSVDTLEKVIDPSKRK